MAKYRIINENLYNCDETGFIIGIITALIVITRSDKIEKPKSVQPSNQE